MEKSYPLKADQLDFQAEMLERMKGHDETLKKKVEMFDASLKKLHKQVEKEIKKAKQELIPSAFDETNDPDAPPIMEGLRNFDRVGGIPRAIQVKLDTKAERSELDQVFNSKASKNDTELLLRWVETVHK